MDIKNYLNIQEHNLKTFHKIHESLTQKNNIILNELKNLNSNIIILTEQLKLPFVCFVSD